MKKSVTIFGLILLSSGAFAQLVTPECKDVRGNVLTGSIAQLRQVMNSKADRPQVLATGTVTSILPEDDQGLPHQKYYISIGGQINLEIVSNLDFDRIPLQVGETVSVCGEYINADQGMIHWTHYDPHGGHADGFTLLNGHVYGQEQTSTTGEADR